jgi:hypothetical protein
MAATYKHFCVEYGHALCARQKLRKKQLLMLPSRAMRKNGSINIHLS